MGSFLDVGAQIDAMDTSAVGGSDAASVLGGGSELDNTIDRRSTLGNTAWNIGAVAALGGSIISSIGAYASAVAQEENLKSGADTAEHLAIFDDLGATQARLAAQDVVNQGRRRRGRYGLRASQEQASQRASGARRGVVGNVGSQAEVKAGLRYAQIVDELTIDSNTLRQRQALERQELSLRNRAEMRRVSAENMRRTAGVVSPGLAAATQALQGLASVGGSFAQRFA